MATKGPPFWKASGIMVSASMARMPPAAAEPQVDAVVELLERYATADLAAP
jgi:hypothetical protein